MRIVFVVKVLPIKLPKHYQLQYNIKSTSLYAIHHNHSNHIPNVASTAEYIDVVQFNEYSLMSTVSKYSVHTKHSMIKMVHCIVKYQIDNIEFPSKIFSRLPDIKILN